MPQQNNFQRRKSFRVVRSSLDKKGSPLGLTGWPGLVSCKQRSTCSTGGKGGSTRWTCIQRCTMWLSSKWLQAHYKSDVKEEDQSLDRHCWQVLRHCIVCIFIAPYLVLHWTLDMKINLFSLKEFSQPEDLPELCLDRNFNFLQRSVSCRSREQMFPSWRVWAKRGKESGTRWDGLTSDQDVKTTPCLLVFLLSPFYLLKAHTPFHF